MTATLSVKPAAPRAIVFSQTSAISSLGLADDLHRADRLAVDNHRHGAAGERRRDQRRKPGRGAFIAPTVGAADRAAQRQRRAGRILDDDAHMTHQPQLRAEVGEEFFRRHLLLHQSDRLAHQELGQLHRGGDLDPCGGAGLENRHHPRQQAGDHVDDHEHDDQLRAHRAAVPQRMRQPMARRPRERIAACALGADACSPGCNGPSS